MAEYKGIHGTKIQNYTSDPANPLTGQVWFNDTSNSLKFEYQSTTDAWSTGGNLNTGRQTLAGSGTQTAALAFGGSLNPGITGQTEEWNGVSWTEVADLATGRRAWSSGAGSSSSAIAAGGEGPSGAITTTEEWTGAGVTLTKTIETD